MSQNLLALTSLHPKCHYADVNRRAWKEWWYHLGWKDDPEFFKGYLKQHPNDKFAWYLLGKEYLRKGEEAKAAYCFTQAGEIYLAFENDEQPNYERIKHALENSNEIAAYKASQRNKRAKRIKTAMLILLLLLIPSFLRSNESIDSAHLKTVAVPSEIQQEKEIVPDPINEFRGYGFIYLRNKAYSAEYSQALNQMIGSRTGRLEHNLLISGTTSADGKWSIWPQKPVLLLSVQTESNGGQSNIRYYDQESCQCEPGDGKSYEEPIANWKREQEEQAVVLSAIAAYEKLNGKLPNQPEDLYQSYPNNMLSGLTPYMREIFNKQMKDKTSANLGSDLSGTGTQPTSNDSKQNPAQVSHNPLSEPLAIIIDRKNYHLAIVSGQTIVRSYPVGLGGNKTPEGEFEISEKVRNPNGKSDGDFGSRGMTLSDTLYAIHGTNEPDSINKDESLGCIRMHNEDVEELFAMVPLGTKVTIGTGLLPPLPPSPSSDGKAGPGPASGHSPFEVPSQTEERNPNKIYRWLL
jgi:lipoprotein-anchoring transpeptidase ErfK/SrfK